MKRFDPALPLGLAVGSIALIIGAWLEGVSLLFLWQPAALFVVVGGTLGAVIVRRGVGGVRSCVAACARLRHRETPEELEAALARLAWLARTARRDGVRVYEQHAATTRDPLLKTALLLAAEYADAATVRRALDRILDEEDERGAQDVQTLEGAGSYAPTFGILGAVLGLVHVLRSLADPSSLGFGIATAFVATIYGVGVANLFFLPVAARLHDRHAAHMRRRELLADALLALARDESPTSILANSTSHFSLDNHAPKVARTGR